MKGLRDNIRYPVEYVTVEIDGIDNLKGTVSDISAGGLSFIIEIGNNEFNPGRFLFIRINFARFVINAEVEKRWGLVKDKENRKVYTAGVSFKVISNEDRLKLNEIIEYFRSEPSSRQSL